MVFTGKTKITSLKSIFFSKSSHERLGRETKFKDGERRSYDEKRNSLSTTR